jgi:hypothetical protein
VKVFRPVCGAFLERRNPSFNSSCRFCARRRDEHEFIDATVWSSAGPFIEAGRTEVRVPNPDYRPEAAA